MERVCRPRMSTAEKAEVWRRWKRGESVSDIGRALGRFRKSVHRVVAAHGGVPPRARTRSRCALTVAEREEISRGLANDCSFRRIASAHRRPAWASPVDRQPGGTTAWGPDALSGSGGRRPGVGSSAAPQVVPVGDRTSAAPPRGREAR